MSKLQEFIDIANERSFKVSNYKISEKDAEKLKIFEPYAEKINLVFSFYSEDHKVKAKFKHKKIEYIIDLFLDEEDDFLKDVFVGRREKDEYKVILLNYNQLKEYLKEIFK